MKMYLSLSLALLMAFSAASCKKEEPIPPFIQEPERENGTAFTGMRDLTSNQLVADMGAGWNLGNSLDTEDADKTAWGNPEATQAMIDDIRDRGFKTLRLPVTWRFHTGPAPEYLIDEVFMSRVEEVANYAFSKDMYVILNLHHEDHWLIPTYALAAENSARLRSLWTQIANRFEPYGDYLIFEPLNEPRHENTPQEWSGGTAEGREVVNQFQKACVDAIRATGGNNATRHLLVSPYAASPSPIAMNALEIPNDDERIIVSIHSYFPVEFCLSDTRQNWGTDADKQALDGELDRVKSLFIDQGRAVIMGEWGSSHQGNLSDRLAHAQYYAEGCAARGIMPVVWDNGNPQEFGLFDRRAGEWVYPEIADAIIEARQ